MGLPVHLRSVEMARRLVRQFLGGWPVALPDDVVTAASATADPRTGYETDSLVPFIAYLGIGLIVAMAYARSRARRGRHRGLTLVSLAVAIAATVQCIAFTFDPVGGLERGDDLPAHVGVGVPLSQLGCTIATETGSASLDDATRASLPAGLRPPGPPGWSTTALVPARAQCETERTRCSDGSGPRAPRRSQLRRER